MKVILPSNNAPSRVVKTPFQVALESVAKKTFHLVEMGGRCEATTEYSFPSVLCSYVEGRAKGAVASKFLFDYTMQTTLYLCEPGSVNITGVDLTAQTLYALLCTYCRYPSESVYMDFSARMLKTYPSLKLVRKDPVSFTLATVVNEHPVMIEFAITAS